MEYEDLKKQIRPLNIRETNELTRLHLLDLRRLQPDEIDLLTNKTLEFVFPCEPWLDQLTIIQGRDLALEIMKLTFQRGAVQKKECRLH